MSSELPCYKVSWKNPRFPEIKENSKASGGGCQPGLRSTLKMTFLKGLANPLVYFIGSLLFYLQAFPQDRQPADSLQFLTLDQCIVYALKHQPAYLESAINVSIARKTNAISLSGWLPQVSFGGNLTHYDPLPTSFTANPLDPSGSPLPVHSGITNTFTPQVNASQAIINPDVLYAARSAHLFVESAMQSSDSTKINLITSVSKSFFSLLLTLAQMNVLKDDTTRLGKTQRDAYHQYISGVVDKTDYQEATISLNNSRAQLKQAVESVRPLYAILKQLIGLAPEKEFNVSYDTNQMMKKISIDTNEQLLVEKRIEYQQLQTVKKLQEQNVQYYRSQYLPALSAFYNYVYEYENNNFSQLLNQSYPYSYMGASVSIPLFTGLRWHQNVQKAKLEMQKTDWQITDLKSRIYSEYSTALATYKSNLYNMNVLRENMIMARDVYGVVSLQYKQGLIAYLNVITAESNLISSQISFLNALFQVLSSKVDLEKAMGNTLSKY
jgi:outer membrane protein TolC